MASTVAQARELIAQNRVRVAGAVATNAARQVASSEPVIVETPPARFVSRAGFKLEGALETFAVQVRDRWVLDAGSSTGGFTDCLLSRGAARVTAVDVGTNQLHEHLRGDNRVELRERTDIRSLTRADIGAAIDLVTADLSFISLIPLVALLVELAGNDGELVLLVKPQFEAKRVEVDRGSGIITDPEIWERVLYDTMDAVSDAGAGIMGVMQSVLRGAAGNTEFFVHARNGAASQTLQARDEMVKSAVSVAR